jgi:hypothetical protein
LFINILSLLYIFFHIYYNNNNNEKRKYAKNKGMVNIPRGVWGETRERRERRERRGWRLAKRQDLFVREILGDFSCSPNTKSGGHARQPKRGAGLRAVVFSIAALLPVGEPR